MNIKVLFCLSILLSPLVVAAAESPCKNGDVLQDDVAFAGSVTKAASDAKLMPAISKAFNSGKTYAKKRCKELGFKKGYLANFNAEWVLNDPVGDSDLAVYMSSNFCCSQPVAPK